WFADRRRGCVGGYDYWHRACLAPLFRTNERVAEGGVVAGHTAGECPGRGEGAVGAVVDLERAGERTLGVLPGAERPPRLRRRVRYRSRCRSWCCCRSWCRYRACLAPLFRTNERVAEGGVVAGHTAGDCPGRGEGAVGAVVDV